MHRKFVRKVSGDCIFLKFCIIIDNRLAGNENAQKVCKNSCLENYTFLKFCIIIDNRLAGNENTQRMHRKFVRKLSGDCTFLEFCIIIGNRLAGNENAQKVCKKGCMVITFS